MIILPLGVSVGESHQGALRAESLPCLLPALQRAILIRVEPLHPHRKHPLLLRLLQESTRVLRSRSTHVC